MKIKAGLAAVTNNGQFITKHKRRHDTNRRRPAIYTTGGNNAVSGDKVKDKQTGLNHIAVVKKPMMLNVVTHVKGDDGKRTKIILGNERTYPDVTLARLAFEKDAANKLDINESNRPTVKRSAKSFAMATEKMPACLNGKRESNNSDYKSGATMPAFVPVHVEIKRRPFKRYFSNRSKLRHSHKVY